MRQPQDRAGAHRGEDLLRKLGKRSVCDQCDHEVRAADHVEHLAEGAVRFAEPLSACGRDRCRPGPESHRDHDVCTDKRVAQVHCLRATLRPPPNHPDTADPVKRGREAREKVAAAGEDLFGSSGKVEIDEIEALRFHTQSCTLTPVMRTALFMQCRLAGSAT